MILIEYPFVDSNAFFASNIWFTWILVFKSRFFWQDKNIMCTNKSIMSPDLYQVLSEVTNKQKFVGSFYGSPIGPHQKITHPIEIFILTL